MIIYEDNDPWNWTCADNQQWLDTFKYQHGLDVPTNIVAQHLAEVPIMAPYVIKGGLKAKTTTPTTQRKSSSHDSTPAMTADYSSMPASATATTFDQNMDFDFDSIDFSGLDLGMIDDVNFDMGMGDQTGSVMGGATAAAGTSAPFSSSIPATDSLFGSYSMAPAMDLGMGMAAPQKQPENGLMTEQDLNQLNGYMAQFH